MKITDRKEGKNPTRKKGLPNEIEISMAGELNSGLSRIVFKSVLPTGVK